MKSKVVEDADVVTYVVVCDPGDEAVGALSQFARDEQLEASQITGVAETLAEVAVGAQVELPGRSLQLAQGVEGPGGVLGRAVQGLQADEVGGGDAGPPMP